MKSNVPHKHVHDSEWKAVALSDLRRVTAAQSNLFGFSSYSPLILVMELNVSEEVTCK